VPLQLSRVENRRHRCAKVGDVKVWEHLVDQFPIFGQECDWQKFHDVMSRYQNDWRPFSGLGRKMVKVVVAERHPTKALHAPCTNQPDPVDGDVSHDGQGPANYSGATFVGMLPPPKPKYLTLKRRQRR